MPFTLTRIPLHLLFLPVLTIKSNPTSRFSSKLTSPGHQTKHVLLWNLLFFSHSIMSNSLQAHGLQHGRLPFPSLSLCLLKLISTESVMPPNCLILCCHFILLPSIFPSIRVFSNESVLHIRWPKYWSFSFSTSPSNEYSGLFSFRID